MGVSGGEGILMTG